MLPLEPIVDVNINMSTSNVANGVFDIGLMLAKTNTTTAALATQLKTYNSLTEAISAMTTAGFVSTDDPYKAAVSYFGVDPAPAKLLVYYYASATAADAALAAAIAKTTEFYGLIAPSVVAKADILALSAAVEAAEHPMIYFAPVSGTASSIYASGSILTDAYATGRRRTLIFYGDEAALMGLAMGLERTHSATSFALCYKQIVGATPTGSISQTDISGIEALNGNVYITRGKSSNVFEKGTTLSGARYDEIMYVDQIANRIQIALLNLIVNSNDKLPQTDSTTTLFVNECNRILEQYYNRGILATLPWRGNAIMQVENGDMIERGYCCMADSFDNQLAADRAAHKAMPITILLCLSGAVESVVITLNVQQ